MSQQITTAMIQSYGSNVIALYQQADSKLQGAVKEEPMKAKTHFFDRIAPTAAVKKTVRHGATPIVDSPHSRRAVSMVDYEWADLVDQQDELRILIDPKSAYAVNAVKALKRTYDDLVIEAFDADAKSGENGTDTVLFTDEDAGDEDFSAAAMDIDDLLTLKQKLDEQEVPADGRFILVAPSVLSQLLRDSEVSSADFNSVKTLVRGEINTYLGFTFITSNRLPTVASTDKYGFAWHKDSMGVAVGMPIKTNISIRDDLSYATQVYASLTMGAVRLQGAGVVRYRFDDNL
jgi:hypothetical protein